MATPVLFSDAHCLVVVKPPGMTVIPARDGDKGTSLRHVLEAEGHGSLLVVHRIDRETSGLVIFARTPAAHRLLNEAFAKRDVSKTYLALVAGEMPAAEGVIDVPLHTARRGRMRPAWIGEEGTLPSVTRYLVLARGGPTAPRPVAALQLSPETGRQHQLRVHCRAVSCPIVGDTVYAPAGARALATRLMLHAARLEVPSPTGTGRLVVISDPPDDFLATATRLGIGSFARLDPTPT